MHNLKPHVFYNYNNLKYNFVILLRGCNIYKNTSTLYIIYLYEIVLKYNLIFWLNYVGVSAPYKYINYIPTCEYSYNFNFA